ncbi:tryptophan-rich sensory protein [Elioraea tepida]|jgi:tryptophan-rich sensory protein|uniref:Tryptophan-rich sensory protein n=1 Tax=Elioraea tepida TaxID=2843330 RepID=A0A975YKF8_9PROT|nr:TspO/MBR family protein [Elioraea tepida]QXM25432.1 tryptophan-rich sensory protein [Elioraea tepida]
MDALAIAMLAGFLLACFLAASTAAVYRPGPWYESLRKPWWRPPNWLFPPAWAVLYVMIATSGWLVWRERGFVGAALPLAVWGLQLVLNALWSPIFFGLRRLDLAFCELVLLWLSIAACILLFAPISAASAWLMAPYLAWVSFAGMLNYAVWQMNRPRNRIA